MPDTPTLRDAAEALLNEVDGAIFLSENRRLRVVAAVTALRAALAADAAWRARAEAAIAVMEARRAMVIAKQVWLYPDPDDDKAAMRLDYDSKRDAYIAARRRYEETCRG